MRKTKPYCISKQSVMAAWERVKANKGSQGVDQETIEEFGKALKVNLYKLWNRMSSGTYFPPAVRRVEIPKSGGKKRKLGIPTVGDRIAQGVVKHYLEPLLEPYFHENSYGYRPKKSALEAVGVARRRSWHYDWCIDLDIKGFFDNLDHGLIMKAVKFHTRAKWIHLYVERWLKAPLQLSDGSIEGRDKGTPQGGVISPLLANLFMHYAFDIWVSRNFPGVKFERYADDVVIHTRSRLEAEEVLRRVKARMEACRLELNPTKTKIVYCKDAKRPSRYEHEQYDFLGYTFRPRLCSGRGKGFVGFTPGISRGAKKGISEKIRGWRLHRRSDKSIEDLSRMFNREVQGWINYYGRYYRSGLYPIVRQLEQYLIRWVMRKHKRLRGRTSQASKWLRGLRHREPGLFAHWSLLLKT